jgi:hypothetical protein
MAASRANRNVPADAERDTRCAARRYAPESTISEAETEFRAFGQCNARRMLMNPSE